MSSVNSSGNTKISPSAFPPPSDINCASPPGVLKRSGTTPCYAKLSQYQNVENGNDISRTSLSSADTAVASTAANLSNVEYRTFPDLVSSVVAKRKEQESKNARKLLKDIEKELKRIDGKVNNAFCEEASNIVDEGKRVCGKRKKSKTLVNVTGTIVEVVQAYNRTIWAAACQNDESAIVYLGRIDQEFHPEIICKLPYNVICMKAIGKYIWVGTKSEDVLLFDADHPTTPQKKLLGHTAGPVNAIVGMPLQGLGLSQASDVYPVPMNGVAFTAAGDLAINVWNISTLELVHTIKTVSDPVRSLCVTEAGDLWIATTRGIISCQVFKNYKTEPVDTISYLSYKRTDGVVPDPARSREKQYDALQKENGYNGAMGSNTPSKIVRDKTCLAVSSIAENPVTSEKHEPITIDEKDLRNIISMVYLNGEVWGCSHTAVFCWGHDTKKRLAVFSVPFVTRLALSGPDVFGFSLFGIYTWNVKNQPKVFSCEPAYSGLFASVGKEIRIIAGMVDGKISSFPTKFCTHTIKCATFSSQCFCCVCHKSLRVGTKSGFACANCESFMVHSPCLPFVQLNWVCVGGVEKGTARESSSHPLMAPMQTQSKIKPSPEMVAKSLLAISLKTDPEIIGDWLSSPGNEQVVEAWIGGIGVAKLNFEMALRKFWSSTMVPNESKKRDRLLNVFGDTYFRLSRNSFFSCGDACYSLASSCVFLNSLLHSNDSSGNVSQERWIASNEGLNSDWSENTKNVVAHDFDKNLLAFLYCQIKETPLTFTRDSVPLMQGRLTHRGKVVFCKLTEDSFSVFSKQDLSPLGVYKVADTKLCVDQKAVSFDLICGPDEQRLAFVSNTKFKTQVWVDAFKAVGVEILP